MIIEIFKRLRHLSVATLIISVAAALCGCVAESDIEENSDQRDDIVDYLESNHTPKLIAESAISESFDEKPEFYFEYSDYAFLYIKDYYNADRDAKSEIKSGSRVLINFRLYEFTGADILPTDLPYYTNEPLYEELYKDAGMNTEYWTFSPMQIEIGKTTLIEGIKQALLKCREGDIAEVYMTRNMGYGDDVIGNIEQYSPLVFYCTILKVDN